MNAHVRDCPAIAPRLWVYTNFDCNLQCSYCVAMSGPRAERRGLAMQAYRRLIDEAVGCGVREVFLTGGEPLLLPDIAERIRYAAERLTTTVLTNASLLHGRRREAIQTLVGLDVQFQVSLDAAKPDIHDRYRGSGSWQKAVDGIAVLAEMGMRVSIGSTETPANAGRLDKLRAFVAGLGIPPERHFIRPLAQRGFSCEGVQLAAADLEPEITAGVDGIYWHPLACEDDMLVSRRLFPFRDAMARVHEMYHAVLAGGGMPQKFR